MGSKYKALIDIQTSPCAPLVLGARLKVASLMGNIYILNKPIEKFLRYVLKRNKLKNTLITKHYFGS